MIDGWTRLEVEGMFLTSLGSLIEKVEKPWFYDIFNFC